MNLTDKLEFMRQNKFKMVLPIDGIKKLQHCIVC